MIPWKFHDVWVELCSSEVPNINPPRVRNFYPNITSLEHNSTGHLTLMSSSEVILKVTFAINSVSTSFTLIENEFLASCENPRCFSKFQ